MKVVRSKLFAVIAVAIGMSMLVASPVAAVVEVRVPANGLSGTLTIGSGEIFFPDPESELPCESDRSGLHFRFDGTYWQMKGTLKLVFEYPEGSGDGWQADFTFDPDNFPNGGNLTWSNAGPPPEWIVDGLLTPQVTVYQLDNGCEKDDPVCDLIMQLEVDSSTSRHYGSVPPVAANVTHAESSTDPNGTRPIVLGACSVTIQSFIESQFVGLVLNISW